MVVIFILNKGVNMKRLILSLVFLSLMVTPLWAIETILQTPLAVVESQIATKMIQYSFTVIPSENTVRASMQWKDASGNPIAYSKECEFVDPAVTNAVITSGKVGQKYIDVMAGFIQTKCKGLWNITGIDQ